MPKSGGGREVVLDKRQRFEWMYDENGVRLDVYHCESCWLAFLMWHGMDLSGKGDTHQAAVTDLESKLLALRDELNRVLWDERKG